MFFDCLCRKECSEGFKLITDFQIEVVPKMSVNALKSPLQLYIMKEDKMVRSAN